MNNFSAIPTFFSTSDKTTPSEANDKEAAADAWKNLGTSVNAISFGFVLTAILVSMFLIMAIFEYLMGSRAATYQASQVLDGRPLQMQMISHDRAGSSQKANNSLHMAAVDMNDISVLMPGQRYPTYLA